MTNEFPSNSHSSREARQERDREKPSSEGKQVRQVTRSKAMLRKRPLWKKFLDAFRPEDNVGFVEYALLEVLAPGVKDAMMDTAHGAVDNAFGNTRRRGRRDGYTSYNRMGSARHRGRRERDDDDRGDRRRGRAPERRGSEPREIILDTRVEADEVLDSMFELISKYEVATMRDLLSLVGESHNYTDEDWGWSDLRGARIHKIRDGYLLDLPRPEPLD